MKIANLVVILVFALLVGCGKPIEGKYVNKALPDKEYVILKGDGTFSTKEASIATHGTYEVSDNELMLKLASGLATTVKINEDGSLTDRDGKTWIKKE